MTETPAKSSTTAGGTPAVEAPPLAPDGAPICYVVDEEPSIRHFLSLILHGAGVDTVEFPDGSSMRKAVEARPPALVFHNISLESTDAIESVIALGKLKYRGAVQLMSARGAAVLEHVKGIGAQHKLNMMPVLKKPFETDTIIKIIQELKLGMPPAVAARLELDDASTTTGSNSGISRKSRCARNNSPARKPTPGCATRNTASFWRAHSRPMRPDAATLKLSELALESALKTGAHFSKLGVNLRLAVNIPMPALVKLPIEDIIKAHHPADDKWPGLIIDVPEEQIVTDLALATDSARNWNHSMCGIAIDNFGRAYSAHGQGRGIAV